MMQISERGNKLLLLRRGAGADGKKKEVVGTLRGPAYAVDDQLRAKLDPAELKEVEAFINRAKQRVTLAQDYAVANFAASLDHVSNWLKTADPAEAKALYENIRKSLTRVRRQFAKAGGEAADATED